MVPGSCSVYRVARIGTPERGFLNVVPQPDARSPNLIMWRSNQRVDRRRRRGRGATWEEAYVECEKRVTARTYAVRVS